MAWNEAWAGTEQVRVFKLDGDTLRVGFWGCCCSWTLPAAAATPAYLVRSVRVLSVNPPPTSPNPSPNRTALTSLPISFGAGWWGCGGRRSLHIALITQRSLVQIQPPQPTQQQGVTDHHRHPGYHRHTTLGQLPCRPCRTWPPAGPCRRGQHCGSSRRPRGLREPGQVIFASPDELNWFLVERCWGVRAGTRELAGRPDEEDQVHVERSRIRLLTGGAALMLTLVTGIRSRARAEPLPGITVYKSPT